MLKCLITEPQKRPDSSYCYFIGQQLCIEVISTSHTNNFLMLRLLITRRNLSCCSPVQWNIQRLVWFSGAVDNLQLVTCSQIVKNWLFSLECVHLIQNHQLYLYKVLTITLPSFPVGPEHDFNVQSCQSIVDYAKHQDEIMSVTNSLSVMHFGICLHTCAQFKD